MPLADFRLRITSVFEVRDLKFSYSNLKPLIFWGIDAWRRYFFILYVIVVSASTYLGRLPFSRFPVQYLFFTPKFLLFMPISRAT